MSGKLPWFIVLPADRNLTPVQAAVLALRTEDAVSCEQANARGDEFPTGVLAQNQAEMHALIAEAVIRNDYVACIADEEYGAALCVIIGPSTMPGPLLSSISQRGDGGADA